MKKLVIYLSTIICASFSGIAVNAQNPSLELSWLSGSWNPSPGPTTGPSIATQLQTFQLDLSDNSNFTSYSPAVTVTTALRNQVFTGYNYSGQQGTVTTGLSFGTQKSEWNDPLVTTQGPRSGNLYDLLGANVGALGPTASLYTSFAGEPLGTIDADFSQFGSDANGGVTLFTTVEPLKNLPGVVKDGRYLYGQLVINFSRKVKDPVLNLASLGGSSWYQLSTGSPWNMAYFSTELELQSPGFTSVRLSGTPYFNIQGNNILNSAARPNGDSQTGGTDVKGFSTFGAASGSVQILGNVDSLVYNVYMRGSSLSDYPFTFDAVSLLGATRNPFYGDFWAISYSMKRPTQQISGNVFDDRDGLTDNNINQSFGSANPRTNAGGTLYVNLIQGGLVRATLPVSANGDFLFDNIPINNGYTVQLSSNQGVVGQAAPATALPANWVNTGQFIGTGTGSTGTPNGLSSSVNIASGAIQTQVNFGIEQLPNSVDYTHIIGKPKVGDILPLYDTLQVLQGSDPEDQPVSGTLSAKSVKITTVPTNAQLQYNGVTLASGAVITNYNPQLLRIVFNQQTSLGYVQFNYAYIDAAGNPDPTPALYKLIFFPQGALPITLTAFDLVTTKCTTSLNWQTVAELNTDRFEVQVSTDNGNTFALAGTVKASGNNNTGKSYQFNYSLKPGVVNYFRLKMIDKDGNYSYSDIIHASCNGGNTDIMVYPNPAQDHFYISGLATGKNVVQIYANNGKLVYTQVLSQVSGIINISNLANGVYNIKVTAENGNVFVTKLIRN